MDMTAEDVRKALRKRFSDNRQYAVAEEVGLTTGYSHRRLDMVVVDCFSSNGFRIDGIEIKVSTADLRKELEDPEKHVAFFDKIDYFTLACPAEVVKPLLDVIPKKWGILIVNEDGTTKYKKRPLALEDVKADRSVPRGFMASMIRSIINKKPVDSEIKQAYENGRLAEQERQGYIGREVRENYQKLQKYNDLMIQFRLWNMDDIDKAISDFEAFRKLRINDVEHLFEEVKEKLDGISALLNGKDGEQKCR